MGEKDRVDGQKDTRLLKNHKYPKLTSTSYKQRQYQNS